MIVGCADSAGTDGLKTGGRVRDLMGEGVDVAEVLSGKLKICALRLVSEDGLEMKTRFELGKMIR
jgi:hypothetical protein